MSNYNPLTASKNDIVYCGDVVVRVAQRLNAMNLGAQWAATKKLAATITGVTSPMSPFIASLFAMLNQGMGNLALFSITDEELQCLQATLWYEQQLAALKDVEKIQFLKESIIYKPVNTNTGSNASTSNGSNASNGSTSNSSNSSESNNTTLYVALGLTAIISISGVLWYTRRQNPLYI